MAVDDGIVIGNTPRVLRRGEIATVINRMNAIEVCTEGEEKGFGVGGT